MSVSLLLGLVYLISDSGLQKNLIGLQRMRSNGQAFKPGIQESRKGIAEIARQAAVELMHRKRFMIGKFPGDARWRADESFSAPRRKCK